MVLTTIIIKLLQKTGLYKKAEFTESRITVHNYRRLLENITTKGNSNTKWINLYPANIYLFKVNNRNTRKRCEMKVNNENTGTTYFFTPRKY